MLIMFATFIYPNFFSLQTTLYHLVSSIPDPTVLPEAVVNY